MRAVAQAHVETGAPITVHTHPGSGTGLRGGAGAAARRAPT